ncbi:MAG: energy-coupling factor transporter ATPase [Actinomycetia bacterium]|nr:energy-coupling factor transporter ATPase [Actinomycetes bacterium]
MLKFDDVSFAYPGAAQPALAGVSLTLQPGRYKVLLGANGSGKSTLASLANGLLLPSSGHVEVDGMDSGAADTLHKLRSAVGLVAQDPDDQLVSTLVLDEVAFGPENLGLPPAEIAKRVETALRSVRLQGLERRDPNTLSGGQKQRLVLAAILAMQPRYLVLDEPTAMLDAEACAEFTALIAEQRHQGSGILHITHDLHFATDADELLVLAAGRLVYAGEPAALLADAEALGRWGLAVAEVAEGDIAAAAPAAAPLPPQPRPPSRPAAAPLPPQPRPSPALRLDNLSYYYPSVTAAPDYVIKGLSLVVKAGSYTLITGSSGVGKSTLLRLAAGLLKPSAGSVSIADGTSQAPTAVVPGAVGLVFQSPEDQLFAATVAEDIAFGPRNLGLLAVSGKKARGRGRRRKTADNDPVDPRLPTPLSEAELVAEALQQVGLDARAFMERSPFTLSGGEMRRLAIAGVLAMRPRFLLLDEPTAGLDAQGRAFIHRLIAAELRQGVAVVVVSHDLLEFGGRADQHLQLVAGRLRPLEEGRPWQL